MLLYNSIRRKPRGWSYSPGVLYEDSLSSWDTFRETNFETLLTAVLSKLKALARSGSDCEWPFPFLNSFNIKMGSKIRLTFVEKRTEVAKQVLVQIQSWKYPPPLRFLKSSIQIHFRKDSILNPKSSIPMDFLKNSIQIPSHTARVTIVTLLLLTSFVFWRSEPRNSRWQVLGVTSPTCKGYRCLKFLTYQIQRKHTFPDAPPVIFHGALTDADNQNLKLFSSVFYI